MEGVAVLADQDSSVDPPGKCSGVGAITSAPGASEGRRGSTGGGHSRSAPASSSASRTASSVPAYSPSPRWYQRSAPPRLQRKSAGQPCGSYIRHTANNGSRATDQEIPSRSAAPATASALWVNGNRGEWIP